MQLANKFAVYDIAQIVVEKFGLQPSKTLPVRKGYRNESRPVVLMDSTIVNVMIFKNEPDILQTMRNADSVSSFLSSRGLPARQLIDSRKLLVSSGANRKYAALYNYLPGDSIPWEAYTRKHLKLLGKTLSDMHYVLKSFDDSHLPDVSEIYLKNIARMRRYFALPGVRHAMSAKLGIHTDDSILASIENLLDASKSLRNKQALHMDFVRSNVLFAQTDDGPKITGILDFEKTARGNSLFDIARTYAFLMVDCKYKSLDKVRKYFLYSGYQKRGQAQLPSVRVKTANGYADLFVALTGMFLLYDFYKFLRHNPYENLHENEHFVRTRDLLIRHGKIRVI